MIKIDEEYSLRKDTHCWVLMQSVEGQNRKTKEATQTIKESYHPNIVSACRSLLDRRAGKAKTLEAIIDVFTESTALIAGAIKEH